MSSSFGSGRDAADHGGQPDAKALQLCSQIEDALTFALSDAIDPVLMDLEVAAVRPQGVGVGQLVVLIVDPLRRDASLVLAALERARGYLRTEVAAEVRRSRVPQLSFSLLPSHGDLHE
ncbi:MAG: hypothetical protein AB8H80_15290 [Planctomycetota bacterium]